MDFNKNKSFAHYNKFWIDDESNKYTLHIAIYSGNAGTIEKKNKYFVFTAFYIEIFVKLVNFICFAFL